jgi:Flp pilus assembly protein TadD
VKGGIVSFAARATGLVLAASVLTVSLSGCALKTPRSRTVGETAWTLDGVPVGAFGPERCGAGSLAAVLAYYGDPISVDELDALLPRSPAGGVLSVDLLIAARERGYEARWIRGDERRIADALASEAPAILMLRVLDSPGKKVDYYHYVVIDGIDPERRLYRFHFGDGRTRWSPFGRALRRAWAGTGHALLVVRPDEDAKLRHAVVLEREGRLIEAEERLREITRSDPGTVRAWTTLGNVLSRQGRTDEAERAYRRALETAPYDAVTLNNLAWLLYERGALDEAETLARQAAASEEHDRDLVLDTLGRIQLAEGRCAWAASSFRRGLDWTPRDRPPARATLLQGLALAHLACGDAVGARAMLERALNLGPDSGTEREIRSNLADLGAAARSVCRTEARSGVVEPRRRRAPSPAHRVTAARRSGGEKFTRI